MGDFRIEIEATGGHGCNRTAKAGEEFYGCGSETCPDCITARFVSEMQRAGMRPFVATFTHWPAALNEHLFLPGAEKCSRCNTDIAMLRQMGTATHRCKVCSALWRLNPAEPEKYPADHPFQKETWSLVSGCCGKCCDTAPMADQIEPITSGIAETRARACRSYDPAREVVDDYSERGVKHPSGAFRRVTAKRVKGAF